MKTSITRLWIVLLVLFLTAPALAGTRDDCITKCKEAGDFIKSQGINAAIKEINNKNGRFVWNDGVSYVFLMNMKAKMLAHPHKPELLKPETLIEAKDVDGKAFFKKRHFHYRLKWTLQTLEELPNRGAKIFFFRDGCNISEI